MRIKYIGLLALSLVWMGLCAEVEGAHEPLDPPGKSEVIQQIINFERLVFRPMSIDDLDKGFVETLSAIRTVDVSKDRMAEIFKERLLQGIHTFVLEEDGNIIATATMVLETKFYRNGRKVAHIEDVAVHPDYQLRGLGRVMMSHIRSEAGANDCYKIILDCSPKNVPFYERSGYKLQELQMRLDLE